MEETRELSFAEGIKTLENDRIHNIITPIMMNSYKLANIFKRRLKSEFPEVFLVSWKKEMNSSHISYDQIVEYNTKYNNCLFIFDNIDDFKPYKKQIINKYSKNYYILINNNISFDKDQDLDNGKENSYYPKFTDLGVIFEDNHNDVYINERQGKIYIDNYNEYKKSLSFKTEEQIEDEQEKLSGLLNIYLKTNDSKGILTEMNLDRAINKSDKFKNILMNLLLHNKKRHLIYMIPGMRGIDAFSHIYNMLKAKNKDIPPLIVLLERDNEKVKNDIITKFNSSNSPAILLTNSYLKEPYIPWNIDQIKIANNMKNFQIYKSILTLAHSDYYTGAYPREITITNYISKTINQFETLDQINYELFKARLIDRINLNKERYKGSIHLFLVRDQIMFNA